MITEQVLFDSRDDYFKRPTGAVKADTTLDFNILVAREPAPESVRLIILYDRHDQPASYELNLTEDGSEGRPGKRPDGYEDHLLFSVSVDIHDTGLYWYHFDIVTEGGILRAGKGNSSRAVIDDYSGAWQQTVYKRAYDTPDWIYGGIYYHAFVDRFHPSGRECTDSSIRREGRIIRTDWGGMPVWQPENGRVLNNDFFGGDLEGIRQKLPYLADLGVTCLYLSPIFEAYSNHKYDTGNYEVIDPMFGSEEDFRGLCSEAGEMGIRVICDGVFSHTGSDSIYFDRYGHYRDRGSDVPGAYLDPASPYRSWYYFHENGSYDCWWDFDTLPKLNKREPSYVDYINGENGIVRRWLRAGAAGWRLDVADELPCDFLDSLVAAAKAEKSDSIIIGEVWEDASNKIAYDERKNYFEGDKLDSVMNYPFRNAIIELVRRGDAESMAETVETIAEHYPPEVLHSLMNLLGTHDSLRIITALAGDELGQDPSRELQAATHLDAARWERGIEMLRKAVLMQMTLPGVPCIYYGDEAGTEGYKDPFNRTCFPWGHENESLIGWYRKITSIRRSNPVYRQGGYRTLAATDGFFAFERYDGRDSIITAVNCGENEHTLTLKGRYGDLLADGACDPGEIGKIEVVGSPTETGVACEGSVSAAPGQMLLLKRL